MADDDIDAPEEWRPVPLPDYAEFYEVSDLGRVRRAAPSFRNAWKGGRLLKPSGHGRYGHLHVSLYRNNIRFTCSVHTLVALAFIGEKPTPQHEIAHGDGDGANNRVGNLRWATSAENKADMRRHGRMIIGEKHHAFKLASAEVTEIRRLYAAGGVTQEELGRRFGVHRVHIGDIVRGKRRYRL